MNQTETDRLRVMKAIMAFNDAHTDDTLTLSTECWDEVHGRADGTTPDVKLLSRGGASKTVATAPTWRETAEALDLWIDGFGA